LSGEREALREKVVLILYDVADHISAHTSSSTMKLIADRILALLAASTPSAELRDEHAKGLVALLAFEKWWRLPNVERTIGAIEPAMRLCLEVLGDAARPAASDGLRDIAGEVWDLLLPYLPLGNRTALYDEMREEFPIAALGPRKEDGLRAWAEKVVSAAQCGCEHCQSWYRSLCAALGRKEGSG
jgi:hypothetical protein